MLPKMLIGVSGSGKTRCCFEIAAASKVIYFDCFQHDDFRNFVKSLQKIGENNLFEVSEICFSLLLYIRNELLKRLPKSDNPKYWLRYQLTAEFQLAVSDIYLQFCEDPPLVRKITTKTLIFDECQSMLNDLHNRYPDGSGKMNQSPLLSALVRIVYTSKYQSYWAGTHLRLKDSSVVASAVGKPAKIFVFTQFNNYTQENIRSLLQLWIYKDIYRKLPKVLLEKACYLLSGRARFISSFITDLAQRKFTENIASSFEFSLQNVYQTAETVESSFFNFWKKSASLTVNVFTDPKPEDTMVVFQVLVGLLVNFFSGGQTICTRESEIDLISSALVRVETSETVAFVYSICEPLPIEAAIKYFSTLGEDYLLLLFDQQMFSPLQNSLGFNAQSRGFLFEIWLVIRVRQAWWKSIPDDSPVWCLFPEWCQDTMKTLEAPQLIVSQKSGKVSHDWCLENFDENSSLFVMPDFHLGPDGLYRFMSYSLKTSWTKNRSGLVQVAKGHHVKNKSKTNIANWCGANKERRDRIIAASKRYPGIVHFRIEFPLTSDPDFISSIYGDSATICVDINSEIAKYMFGLSLIEKWKNFMQ
jgi:hypothetical protein